MTTFVNDPPNDGNGKLIALVGFGIGLQLASAALVKYAMSPQTLTAGLVVIFVVIVLLLNFARLLVWNSIHKHYPISLAYPLSALFFPAVVGVAWAMGERISLMQVMGAFTVMIGVTLILSSNSRRSVDAPPAGK